MKKLSFKSNKQKKKNNHYYSINNGHFNIPIFPVNFVGSCTHNIVLTIYASIKLTIPKLILTVNRTNLAFLFSVLTGNITAAPNQPAARLIRNSEKIPRAILSIFPLYHILNGQYRSNEVRTILVFSSRFTRTISILRAQARSFQCIFSSRFTRTISFINNYYVSQKTL